jgi:hypothetical protein
MKTNLVSGFVILSIISLLLVGCSSVASPTATSTAGLSQAAQLAIGTLKLEGTDQAPAADQAVELLTLWKAYQSLSSSDTTAQAELDALITQIQGTMTSEQIQAIASMQLADLSQDEIMQLVGTGPMADNSSNSASNSSSGASQAAAQPPAAGGGDPGMGPGGDGGGMPAGDQAMGAAPQDMQPSSGQASTTSSQASSGARLQQVSPMLVNAVIKALEDQTQAVSS